MVILPLIIAIGNAIGTDSSGGGGGGTGGVCYVDYLAYVDRGVADGGVLESQGLTLAVICWLKNETYNWGLIGSVWNDTGVWDDTETWID